MVKKKNEEGRDIQKDVKLLVKNLRNKMSYFLVKLSGRKS